MQRVGVFLNDDLIFYVAYDVEGVLLLVVEVRDFGKRSGKFAQPLACSGFNEQKAFLIPRGCWEP